MQIETRKQVSMLSDEVADQLIRFHKHWQFQAAGCLRKEDDHGAPGITPPVIPYAPFSRSRIYTGTRETGSYTHHAQIAKWQGRYHLAFSNGYANELTPGQRLLIAASDDGCHWSPAAPVSGAEADGTVVHTCVGLHATAEALYILDRRDEALHDATAVGMRRVIAERTRVHVLASEDGRTWTEAQPLPEEVRCIFEAPRLTAEGRLLCVCTTKSAEAAMLLWPGSDLLAEPQIMTVPTPAGAAFPYGEGSWYQLAEGRIVVFWRDEGGSCRCWVSYSEDGGRSFVPPMISDLPDSMSRNRAGRLSDGRYFLCNNAFPALLDRRHLMLLLSDDGLTFNQVYLLVDDPTSQRRKGLLKGDGYQYPCSVVDGDRLLVAYSVNKEDIECGVVDTTQL